MGPSFVEKVRIESHHSIIQKLERERQRERRGIGKSRKEREDVEFVLLLSSFSSWAGKRSAPPSMEEDEQPMMMESHRFKRSSGETEDADEVISI